LKSPGSSVWSVRNGRAADFSFRGFLVTSWKAELFWLGLEYPEEFS
jgi:hypothetical protein